MKKFFFLFGTILLNMTCTALKLAANSDFDEPIITAPNAGLVLLYKGQYKPSNHVVYSTTSFPMTTSTCYLLPISGARKIPACNSFTSHIRNKRFLTDI